MACFLVNISGLSGGTYDAQDHKFGLSKLLAATWTDIVKRLMPCSVLVELSRQSCGSILSKGNLLPCSIPRHAPATWTDIVKRQLVALLSPSGILPRHSVLWIDIVKRQFIALFNPKANPCHPVPLKMALV